MTSISIKLKEACFAGDLDEARKLLDAGADPNASDENGCGTLLTFHSAMIELLLSHGADPNSQDNGNGASVRAGLAYVGQLECVRILLRSGADPNRGREVSGETPLHHALVTQARDSGPIVKILLEHGADPNARTQPGNYSFNYGRDLKTRGETPLHRAAAYATADTVALLLDAGADSAIKDVNGDTPHTWALWHLRDKRLLRLL